MKNLFLNTYTRIDGGKFLIVYLMVLGSPFWFAILPMFILSAPMKLIWAKEDHRALWRGISVAWLGAAILTGIRCAFGSVYRVGDATYSGFPLRLEIMPEPSGDSFAVFSMPDYTVGNFVAGLNISIVAATLMLPLTIASYMETRRRVVRGREDQARSPNAPSKP